MVARAIAVYVGNEKADELPLFRTLVNLKKNLDPFCFRVLTESVL